jgi:hypothetical protein
MDGFGGGWALVGYYCPNCEELGSKPTRMGPIGPVQPFNSWSARLSDKEIQSFGDVTFWVKADSNATGTTGACSTFYRLHSSSTYSSSAKFSQLRCSLDNAIFGPPYQPDGFGLTTQSGPRNWEKTSCGNPSKHSSQWVYTYPPHTVNGRDLCVNGGEMQTAFKWLFVRPNGEHILILIQFSFVATIFLIILYYFAVCLLICLFFSSENATTVRPNWRVTHPRTHKVLCNDPRRWPENGHPLYMSNTLSLDECMVACEITANCSAIEYSPNFNGAIDASGQVSFRGFYFCDCGKRYSMPLRCIAGQSQMFFSLER